MAYHFPLSLLLVLLDPFVLVNTIHKLMQIKYNNQRVAVELVMYWDSCKGVSRVLGSTHLIG